MRQGDGFEWHEWGWFKWEGSGKGYSEESGLRWTHSVTEQPRQYCVAVPGYGARHDGQNLVV